MNTYRIGFSIKGFVAFILVMIPNLIWMIAPPSNNPISINSVIYPLFDIIVVISQAIMITLLIILIPRKNRSCKRIKIYFKLAIFCLLVYYIMWIMYYTAMISPWILVGMAMFPSIYFIFIELWLCNYIAIIPSLIFGIMHIAITFSNYIQ